MLSQSSFQSTTDNGIDEIDNLNFEYDHPPPPAVRDLGMIAYYFSKHTIILYFFIYHFFFCF